jgi:hypothetical protein
MKMAVLDCARARAAGASQTPTLANRVSDSSRPPRRLRIAVEIGGTLLVLMLIALGVLALRFVLVLAHGFLN